jgi:diguanylate cyclase (GGDEF)-like protein/PAS domain S-box-containing protein
MLSKFLRNGVSVFRQNPEQSAFLLSDERFDTRAKFSLALAVITALILVAITWKVASDSSEADNRVLHTREVLGAIDQIKFNTLNIEYNTQGLRFTGDLALIAERNVAFAARKKALEQLGNLIAVSTLQDQRFSALQEVIRQRAAIAKRVEELVVTQGSQAATEYVRTVPVKETRERVYRILAEMQAQERFTLESNQLEQSIARGHMVAVSGSVATLLLLLLVTSYYQMQRHLQRIKAVQKEVATSEKNLAITLMSIGDAVLTTDARANITRINAAAERLTGWTAEQAIGKQIEDVYNIVDENTFQPTVIAVNAVLTNGLISSQTQRGVLIAKDGIERPISDSAAPIHDVDGRLQGAILVVRDVTEQRRAAQAILEQNELLERRVSERTRQLQESEVRYRTAFMTSPEPIILSRVPDGIYLDVNNGFEQTFGWTRNEVIGKTSQELGIWTDIEQGMQFLRTVSDNGQVDGFEANFFNNQGAVVTCLLSSKTIYINGQTCILSVLRDFTERKRAVTALRESEERLARVMDGANQGYWDWNLQTNTFDVSPRWETMLGYNPGEMVKDPSNWPQLVHPEDLPRAMTSIERHLRGEAANHEVEIRVKTKEGPWKWILTSGRIVRRDPTGVALMMSGTHTDISQIKAHEAELDSVANFDSLTRLPNRRLLSDRLNQSILHSDRSGKSAAICFLDLDGFKVINDQLGHEAGDQVLIGISQHLSAVMRAGDTLARLGGDEFVLLLSDLGTTEECAQILDRVLNAVRLPINTNGQEIVISASIGVSLYPSDNADPDLLLRHADMAMYKAKQDGKNRYQLFDPEIDRVAQIQSDFLAAIGNALQNQEFILFYQPKVDLKSGKVIGAEALVRWQRPGFGLLTPNEFLPYLNGSHLEARFGEWVMDTALHQLRKWKALGMDMGVSVNISANHLLQPNFSTRLNLTLSNFLDIDLSNLELEVLETAAIGDMQQAIEVMQFCTNLGVRFALDDFGTGYASLTYLRKLPVHTLKIDQSFVRDMLHDTDDLGIVRSIIEMAGVFGRQVVAEGVETKEHGAALFKLGCYRVQGYGIARPMHPELFLGWCEAWQKMEQPWLGTEVLNSQP